MKVAATTLSALVLLMRSTIVRSATYGKISEFRMVHASTGKFIGTIVNGGSIYLNNTNPSMTIVAMPDRSNGPITKVQMNWNKFRKSRTEKIEPYTLCGGKSFARCRSLGVGTHTVSAKVVGSSDAALSVTFTIVKGFAPPRPPVSAAPVPSPAQAPVAPQAPVTPPTAKDATKSPTVTSPAVVSPPIGGPVKPPVVAPLAVTPTKSPTANTVTTPAPRQAPTAPPSKAPVAAPAAEKTPTKSPTKTPVATKAPTKQPIVETAPVPQPSKPPTKTPTKSPNNTPTTKAPTKNPTMSPTKTPTRKPTKAPTKAPTKKPSKAPTKAPVPTAPSAPVPGVWIEENTPIIPRYQACFVMVNNSVVGRRAYLVGGVGDNRPVEVYNPFNRTWTRAPAPPKALSHMQCVTAQGKLWIMAPWNHEKDTPNSYVFDPATNQWYEKTAMPFWRRRGSTAVAVSPDEKKIYVVHGSTGGHEWNNGPNVSQALPYLDEYTIASDTWSVISSSAPTMRDHTGAAFVDGGKYLCVAGGRRGDLFGFPYVAPTDCYNFQTDTWDVRTSISPPRSRSLYTPTCDGKLMVVGGEFGAKVFNNVNIFDGTTWTTLPNLPGSGRHSGGLAVDCACNRIHVVAGMSFPWGQENETAMFTYYPGGVQTDCLA